MANGTQYFLNEEGQYEPMQPLSGAARNRLLARLNLSNKIKEEERSIGEAATKVGTAQSVGGLLGGLAMNALLPGSGLLSGAIGKTLASGLGTVAGGMLGKEVIDDKYTDTLSGKDIAFRRDEASELEDTLTESLYATGIKNALAAGAFEGTDKLFGKNVEETVNVGNRLDDAGNLSQDFEGLIDVTGEGDLNVLDLVKSSTVPEIKRLDPASPILPTPSGLDVPKIKSPEITDLYSRDTDRIFKNVVLEDGTRTQVPIGMKSADKVSFMDRLTSVRDKIKDIKMPEWTKAPQVDPREGGLDITSLFQNMLGRITKTVVDPSSGNRYQLPMGGKLISNILSGNYSSDDLMQFQEMAGLDPTGELDTITAQLLSYYEEG